LPWLALAHAHLGDFKTAEQLISQLPQDCDVCMRTRAKIADMQNQHARADALFAAAVQRQPEAPFANADWGSALLARGDTEAAIAKLKLALEKGPKFADPLETWGEALMRQGDFSAAAAKFKAANALAPQWGRAHLRLGQALAKLGDATAARKELALASTLDLSAPERSELGGAR
jgi:Flp pilus assembly protein TadD